MREKCIAALAKMIPIIEPVITNTELQALLPNLRKIRIGLDSLRDELP